MNADAEKAVAGTAALNLKNLTKRFGKVTAVDNVSLDIPHGKLITLLGPSGCGKTTILRMIAGLEVPSSGHIFLGGEDITYLPPNERKITMVFQSYALFPHMNVGKNIAYGLKVLRWSEDRIRAAVKESLDMVGLEGLERRGPSELSGGQQQRVAVARALVLKPKVLLFDEPLSNLDAKLRKRMRGEIRNLQKDLGITSVYVTHDQSEALTMSDRVAVFDDGGVQQMAPPDVLYEKPENAFVAGFIGENNRLNGTIHSIDGDTCVVKLDDGSEVKSAAINIGQVGERSTLSLRPERVVVEPEAGSQPNMFSGKVAEIIYLGDHLRTRIEMAGHDDFIVKVPNASHHASLIKGDTVNIGWNVEDCRALDAP